MTTVDEAREALLDVPVTAVAWRGSVLRQRVATFEAAVRAETLNGRLLHERYTSGLSDGRAESDERLRALREALLLAHDSHEFGPEDCTPANCSAEAAIQTFADRVTYKGRVWHNAHAALAATPADSGFSWTTATAEERRDVAVAGNLYRALVAEHGHDERHSADWPACYVTHKAMAEYARLEAADKP